MYLNTFWIDAAVQTVQKVHNKGIIEFIILFYVYFTTHMGWF